MKFGIVGEPSLKLISFWLIKGFHECFYFRGTSYKIDIPEDVVAVEIEGKIRDLVGRESSDTQSISGITRRLLGRRDWPGVKSFRLNDATELAYMYKEGLFFLNAEGKEDLEGEAFFQGKTSTSRNQPSGNSQAIPRLEFRAQARYRRRSWFEGCTPQ